MPWHQAQHPGGAQYTGVQSQTGDSYCKHTLEQDPDSPQLHPPHCPSCSWRLKENKQRLPRPCLAQLQPFGQMCPRRVRATGTSIPASSLSRAQSPSPAVGMEPPFSGKVGQFTCGRLSVPSVLTSTTPKRSTGKQQLGKRQGEKQQEAKAWTHQLVRARAGRLPRVLSNGSSQKLPLLFSLPCCKKTGCSGGACRVRVSMSGSWGQSLGQQYLPWASNICRGPELL